MERGADGVRVSLDGRIRKLEARARPAEPCPECGIRPGSSPTLVFVGEHTPDAPLVEYSGCCGRMLRFTLDIGGSALER
jgi:hypothetical protein